MFNKFIIILLLTLQLNANIILQNTYYINSSDIYISTLIKGVTKDKLIYKIAPSKYIKRVKSKELLKVLKENGYKDITLKGRYIKFIKKSPVDTSKISLYIKDYYLKEYKEIKIKEIKVEPRAYIKSLPLNYNIDIRRKNYLSKSGVISIKTAQNKKIFFNYDIVADVPIYLSRKQIKKDVELSALNTIKKSIILDKFMARPLQSLKAHTIQAKYHIKKDKIITTRDVEILNVVKKNSFINISLNSKNMSINFSAKALQNGKLNDIITVQKSNGKRLKVRITGKNKAEIR